MQYEIVLTKLARRSLSSIPLHALNRIDNAILSLSNDPFRPGTRKVKGKLEIYRLRVGDYRILYQVFRKRLLVLVVKIGHRKDIYR